MFALLTRGPLGRLIVIESPSEITAHVSNASSYFHLFLREVFDFLELNSLEIRVDHIKGILIGRELHGVRCLWVGELIGL